MLKTKVLIIVGLSGLILGQSCKKEVFDTTEPVVDPSLDCKEINYDAGAKAIFEAKCIICHGETNAGPGDFRDPSKITNVLAKVRNRVEDRTMPPASSAQLTDDELDVVLKWIDCGASFEGTVVDTTDTTTTPMDTTNNTTPDTLTYEKDIKSLIQAKCANSCHGGSGPGIGDFTNTAIFKGKVDSGKFENRILVKMDMPTTGPLPKEDRDKLQKWLDQGAKF